MHFQIHGSSHQRQTVTDSPYAKPNKATKSSSPQPPVEGTTRIHISETRTTHHYQPQYEESQLVTSQATHIKQNQLDSMLGNLQADMSRQGVNTTQKGCCNACEKPIVGQVKIFKRNCEAKGLKSYSNYFWMDSNLIFFPFIGNHSFRKDLASGTLHLHTLQPRIRHEELLREGRPSLLRTWLPQSLFSTMCLL